MDYAELNDKFGKLAKQDMATRFEQGDLLVEARPLPAEMTKLAVEWGYSKATLVQRQLVAEAFPPLSRVAGIAWTIYAALLVLDKPTDREAVLASRPVREWSVNSIKHAIRLYQKDNGMPVGGSGRDTGNSIRVEGLGTVNVRQADTGWVVEAVADGAVKVGKVQRESSSVVRWILSPGE